jgi:hypothetical protein
MTTTAGRRRVHDKLAALPGVRSVRRPVPAGGTDEFDLYYVRVGEPSAHRWCSSRVAPALYGGEMRELPGRSSSLDAEPGTFSVRLLRKAITAAAAAAAVVPSVVPRAVRHVTATS